MKPKKPLLDKFALTLLTLALVARLISIRTAFWDTISHADDAFNYIFVTYHSEYLGLPEDSHLGAFVTSIAPLYPIYLIPFFKWMAADLPADRSYPYLPLFEAESYQAARIGHALLDTATVLSVYVLAFLIFGQAVGRVALVAQAFDPRALLAIGPIATEPLFIALFSGSLALFVLAVVQEDWRFYAASGLFMGLSIMTRPVPILFPLVLGGYLVWRSEYRRTALRVVGGMIVVCLLIIIPWNIRTGLGQGTFFLPVSDAAFYHLWVTTVEDKYTLQTQPEINEAHMQEFGKTDDITPVDYVSGAISNIAAAPFEWAGRILRDTLQAFLIPYGANIAMPRGTPSLFGTMQQFAQGQISFSELLSLPQLARRILLYLWHLWSLVFGLAGILLALIERKPLSFILLGWVLYASVIASVLLIEPRYVYPILFGFNIFAAFACVRLIELMQQRLTRHPNKEVVSATH